MDGFVPPGYMAVDKLVQLAGQAMFKDKWLGAAEFLSRADHRRARTQPCGLLKTHREMRRAGGDPRAHPEVTWWFATMEEWLARERLVTDRLRLALCAGAIAAAIKLPTGQLVEIPAYFWQGDGAAPAFRTGEATVGDGHGPRRQGRVLFKAAEAEQWLVNLDQPSATATPEAAARRWFLAEVRSEEKRLSRDQYCAEMARQYGVSKRAARRIWDGTAPEAWKRQGAPRRSKSER